MVRVLFLHPDLGIGGAERLVVDAALALKQRGHEVSFLTNHHDPTHCFEETRNGAFGVKVVGDWLPRSFFGRFHAFCAYFRMLYMAFYTSFVIMPRNPVDVVFCDLIPIGIPIVRLAYQRPKIIYYCHHPDQLLYERRDSLLQRVYRAPLNYLEEFTTGMADKVLVNSKYTLRVYQETFSSLRRVPDVLYPTLHTSYFDRAEAEALQLPAELADKLPQNAFIFLDINRYERKKNHGLALHALKALQSLLAPNDFKQVCLVMVGGYDTRVLENVEHFAELQALCEELQLTEHVFMLRSPKDAEKLALLKSANCLIYTPANEHFGIVPLEAMYMSKPVIALNSGGPMETIVEKSTGFLCEPEPSQIAQRMLELFKDPALGPRMGSFGHKRVVQKFSFESFSTRLDAIVEDLFAIKSESSDKKVK